jgi:YidC/Oxa1 family membrane protein insertase
MAIQDPFEADMQKRLLIAMVLSMVIIYWLTPAAVPPPADGIAPPGEAMSEPARPPAALRQPLIAERQQRAPEALRAEMAPTQAVPQITLLQNDNLSLAWNSVGATLQSAQLLNYNAGRAKVEMIPQALSQELGQPLSIRTGESLLDQILENAVYEVENLGKANPRAPSGLTFYYRNGAVEVKRTIRLPAEGYLLEMETEVLWEGRPVPLTITLGPGLGEPQLETYSVDFAEQTAAYYQAGAVKRYTAGDLEDGALRLNSPARWVAMDSQYFTYLLLVPDGIKGASFSNLKVEGSASNSQESSQIVVEVELNPRTPHAIFIGPKNSKILGEADTTLSELIDYGWFAFLVKPLSFALRLTYGYVHNYGLAIIILTFFINLLLFPVRHKQKVSMTKMAQLQPRMKAIQGKYKKMKKDDPRRQKMNEEVMAMYKKHGVNPLGGCLPLLVQMPFLFAFYQMLWKSIELRGAPFVGWIQDLSQADPYYVTPIVMGISMVAQQKMTPASGDPTQRKIMMLMPVVFTFFFLGFSSGLVIYFLFSNLFGMMFQFLMERWGPEVAVTPENKGGSE